MNILTRKSQVLVIVGAMLLPLASVAGVTQVESDAVTIQYRAGDLQTTNGQKALYQQLSRASKKVCGSTSVKEAGTVSRARQNATCAKQALNRAMQQVGMEDYGDFQISQR